MSGGSPGSREVAGKVWAAALDEERGCGSAGFLSAVSAGVVAEVTLYWTPSVPGELAGPWIWMLLAGPGGSRVGRVIHCAASVGVARVWRSRGCCGWAGASRRGMGTAPDGHMGRIGTWVSVGVV